MVHEMNAIHTRFGGELGAGGAHILSARCARLLAAAERLAFGHLLRRKGCAGEGSSHQGCADLLAPGIDLRPPAC